MADQTETKNETKAEGKTPTVPPSVANAEAHRAEALKQEKRASEAEAKAAKAEAAAAEAQARVKDAEARAEAAKAAKVPEVVETKPVDTTNDISAMIAAAEARVRAEAAAALAAERAQTEAALAQLKAEAEAQRLAAYREAKIAQSGVLAPSMVTGSTPEEIDASVSAALALQQSISAAAEEKVRKEMSAHLPRPVNANSGSGPTYDLSNPRDKMRVANLPKAEYDKVMQSARAAVSARA